MGVTYSSAGVDINEENKTIRLIVGNLRETFANRAGKDGEVLPSEGHFANYIKLGDKYLVMCTDGVGTKVLVAQMLDRYDTVGIDMIAMNVNDMICVGAEPLALVDYLAFESHDQRIVDEISKGLVEGARQAGIAIIGGETATLKGVITGLGGKGFDLAGTCVGIVDPDKAITGEKISPGDSIVGLASSGVHSNGLTLARQVLGEKDPALLVPTKIYVKPVLEMLGKHHGSIHGIYHITGSGFRKFNRLRKDVGFCITKLLPIPQVFRHIQEKGQVSDHDMFSTFNMGMGMAVITDNPDALIDVARKHGIHADTVGVVDDSRKIRIAEKKIEYMVG